MFGLGVGGSHAVSPPASGANNHHNGNANTQNKSSQDEGRFVQKYLTNCRSFYSCIYCRTHLANHDELVSRSFQGNRSRAYLFNSVINISCGPSVQRALNTGAHAVADIYCTNCGTTMGWKYEKAYVESQKYKEGKYIIELAHVVRENRHLELDKRDMIVNNFQQYQQQAIASSPSTCSRRASSVHASLSAPDHCSSSIRAANTNLNRWSLSPSSQDHDNEAMIDDSINGDDEDELMFPLCDDLIYVDRSSCPSFSSSLTYGNKARRSFYLDSIPYDWKYSTCSAASVDGLAEAAATAAAANGARAKSYQKSIATAGSLTSSTSSSRSPASASSPSSHSDKEPRLVPINIVQASADCLPSTSAGIVLSAERSPTRDDTHSEQSGKFVAQNSPDCHSDGQMFKFDAESDTDSDHCDQAPNCARSCAPDTSCDRFSSINLDSRDPSQMSPESNRARASVANSQSDDKNSSRANSLNLDDEEFYDCCTDHDVSNSTFLSSD